MINTDPPNGNNADFTAAEDLLDRAQNALEQEMFELAVDQFELLSSVDQRCAAARIGLGDSFFGLGDYEKADAAYRVGLELEEENPDGLFGLAATLRVTEIYDEAIELYEHAFKIEPDRTGAYWELAYSREMVGDTVGAEQAYRTCLQPHPNHGMAKHLLAAMLGITTDRAPDDYIRELFDDYAGSFEKDLVEDLNYIVPTLIKGELQIYLSENGNEKTAPFYSALDLGCGTGLVSKAVTDLVERIDGVDISENMIEIAQAYRRYENTYLEEMTNFLFDKTVGHLSYDLILCGDSLVYLGDLGSLFFGVKSRLNLGGLFCFTLENLQRGQFKLCHTGRYAHSERYISSLAQKFGFKIQVSKSIVPRTDLSTEIDGRIYVLKPLW